MPRYLVPVMGRIHGGEGNQTSLIGTLIFDLEEGEQKDIKLAGWTCYFSDSTAEETKKQENELYELAPAFLDEMISHAYLIPPLHH